MLNAGLAEVDPELYDIIEHEKNRQYKGLELIPSENFVSASVMEAVRACLPACPHNTALVDDLGWHGLAGL